MDTPLIPNPISPPPPPPASAKKYSLPWKILANIGGLVILAGYSYQIYNLGMMNGRRLIDPQLVELQTKVKQQQQVINSMVTAHPTIVLSPSPTISVVDTTTWTTFKDTVVSFRYPSDWTKEGNTLKVPLTKDCLPPNACGGNRSEVFIEESKNTKHQILRDFIYDDLADEYKDKASAFAETDEYKGNALSGGFDQSSINNHVPSGGSRTSVYYSKGDQILKIMFESIDEVTINEILKTIRAL